MRDSRESLITCASSKLRISKIRSRFTTRRIHAQGDLVSWWYWSIKNEMAGNAFRILDDHMSHRLMNIQQMGVYIISTVLSTENREEILSV